MAKIDITDKEQLKKLRELLGDEELFPYADFPLDDTTVVGITLYKKGEENAAGKLFLEGSTEYREDKHGFLSQKLRESIIKGLWGVTLDKSKIEKCNELGIDIEANGKKKGWL